jgi:hypothetical protein
MSSALMDAKPQLHARVAGFLYLVTIVMGVYAEFFARGSLMVHGDPISTARNILTHETLYRLGLAADLIMSAAYIGVTVLLLALLRPVDRLLSNLAAVFSIIGIAAIAANSIVHAAVLVFVTQQNSSMTVGPTEMNSIAYAFLRLHGQGYNIASVFFGFYCTLVGWLIIRSEFLPRLIGALMLIAGVSFLVDSFSIIAIPEIGPYVSTYTSLASLIGEGALTVWLLIFGIDVQRWREKVARGTGISRSAAAL